MTWTRNGSAVHQGAHGRRSLPATLFQSCRCCSSSTRGFSDQRSSRRPSSLGGELRSTETRDVKVRGNGHEHTAGFRASCTIAAKRDSSHRDGDGADARPPSVVYFHRISSPASRPKKPRTTRWTWMADSSPAMVAVCTKNNRECNTRTYTETPDRRRGSNTQIQERSSNPSPSKLHFSSTSRGGAAETRFIQWAPSQIREERSGSIQRGNSSTTRRATASA